MGEVTSVPQNMTTPSLWLHAHKHINAAHPDGCCRYFGGAPFRTTGCVTDFNATSGTRTGIRPRSLPR